MLKDDLPYQRLDELKRRIAVYEDEAAYKEIFMMLFSSLTRFAASIVQSKETAEEIVSDVFIHLWNKRNKLEEIQDLRLYLFIAVKNNAVRKAKQLSRSSSVLLDEFNIEMDSYELNPEDRILSQEAVKEIESAINQLPSRARLIFKLAKEDKMKYKDIASLLHISVKTVDHQLAIALKKIATAIGTTLRKKS
mgnify:CR=1 FL=1